MNFVPQVMISSAFFDLKQVRDDLACMIADELGCIVLVSEGTSFPVDPDVSAIENCRRRVEREVDILLLVIGGRYGFIDSSSSRSVTNIEYLAARAKGIPIYAFVESRVLSVLPVWSANKNGDFASVVDDSRIFQFIEEVRGVHNIWMREFIYARDIAEAFRSQFAHLALQGLRLIRRQRDGREHAFLRELSGVPLRTALETPPGWEHKLFAEVLIEEIGMHRALVEQLRIGIALSAHEHVTLENFLAWSRLRRVELERIIDALSKLVNVELRRALGPPGEPGDADALVFVARAVGQLHEEALRWALRVRCVVVDDGLEPATEAMGRFIMDVLGKVESLGPRLLREIDHCLEEVRRGVERPAVSIILDLELPGLDDYRDALNAVKGRLGSRLN